METRKRIANRDARKKMTSPRRAACIVETLRRARVRNLAVEELLRPVVRQRLATDNNVTDLVPVGPFEAHGIVRFDWPIRVVGLANKSAIDVPCDWGRVQ